MGGNWRKLGLLSGLLCLAMTSCASSETGETSGAKITTVTPREPSGVSYQYFLPENIPDNSIITPIVPDSVPEIQVEDLSDDAYGSWTAFVGEIDRRNQEISALKGAITQESADALWQLGQHLRTAEELPVAEGLEELYGVFCESALKMAVSYEKVAGNLLDGLSAEELLLLTTDTVIETEAFYKAATALGVALESGR